MQGTQKQEKRATILCALCGIKFIPQQRNICEACTLAEIKQTMMLSAAEEILSCRFCLRYERPPWINCERESQQLLALLLRKVKGLNKVTLKSAKFVWTEPHSKRIKLRIEIEKEIDDKIKVQQTELVEFVERVTQCPDCKKNFTPHDWDTVVQVRQHVAHKKTLLQLQQNLLKQKFSDKLMKIEPVDEGIDFFFKNEHEAHKYVDYIKSNVAVSLKQSKQLVSHNERDNITNVKTTISLTIPKVCKDDLLKLHPVSAKELGCGMILLCTKITSMLHFMDVSSFKKVSITIQRYFHYEPYMDFYSIKHFGKRFMVLDNEGKLIEENGGQYPTWGLIITPAKGQVKQIFVKSQIQLQFEDQVIGYDFTDNQDWECKNPPEYILVKKAKRVQQKTKKKGAKEGVSEKMEGQQKSLQKPQTEQEQSEDDIE